MAKNNRVKRAHVVETFTADQLQEIDRCMYGYYDPKLKRRLSGPVYFARNYVRIQHPRLGDLPFEMFPYQEEMIDLYLNSNKVVVLASRQVGKEQPHYSKIATPTGWTTMGDIAPGDTVLTPDGKTSIVLMKHPQGKKDVYRISFDDGSFADCGIDHLWKCIIRNKLITSSQGINDFETQEQVISTNEMIQYIKKNQQQIDDCSSFNVYIPTVDAVNFDEQTLRLDPYQMGLYSRDGSTPIPELYLRSSISQRTDLLKGILNTDESVIQYTTTSESLQYQIQQLVWSLGGKCSVTKVLSSDLTTIVEYSLSIILNKVDGAPLLRSVVDIQLIGQEESSCISIDHPDHLYITDNYTVTHNTVVACAFLLWYAIFVPNKTILIAANKNDNAMEIVGRIQYAYEYLPMWIKPGVKDDGWNKHECKFDNDSRIVSTATSGTSGRGMSISLLYLDEFAFVKPSVQEEFWTSILPTLSTGGAAIITSTPNGAVDKFSSIWRAANLESNTDGMAFKPFQVAWDEPPGRDEKFKREMIGLLGETKWRQEYECAGGDTTVTIKFPDGMMKDITLRELYQLYNEPEELCA